MPFSSPTTYICGAVKGRYMINLIEPSIILLIDDPASGGVFQVALYLRVLSVPNQCGRRHFA